MDIAAGLQSVGVAIEIAKGLRALDKAWDQVALKAQVIDLMDALVSTKAVLVDAQEAAITKDKQIKDLRAAFQDRSDLVLGRDGYKYKTDQSGRPDGYPACPHCEPVEGRIVFLVPDGYWQKGKCPACLTQFDPVHPYNSEGEREEREQLARDEAAMAQARGKSSFTGY